jgi:hypothetical protein
MSQVETTQTETSIEPKELTLDEIKNLVLKAIEEKRIEARYILVIEEWIRQGPSFEDSADFEVVYGEAYKVELMEWNEGYPYRKGHKYLLIPKTVPVVVLWRHKWDYETEVGEFQKIYVFTSEGWKEVKVK